MFLCLPLWNYDDVTWDFHVFIMSCLCELSFECIVGFWRYYYFSFFPKWLSDASKSVLVVFLGRFVQLHAVGFYTKLQTPKWHNLIILLKRLQTTFGIRNAAYRWHLSGRYQTTSTSAVGPVRSSVTEFICGVNLVRPIHSRPRSIDWNICTVTTSLRRRYPSLRLLCTVVCGVILTDFGVCGCRCGVDEIKQATVKSSQDRSPVVHNKPSSSSAAIDIYADRRRSSHPGAERARPQTYK